MPWPPARGTCLRRTRRWSRRSSSTVQYSTQYSAVQYTVQYSAVQYTVQCNIVQYIVSWPHFTMSTVPHCTTLQACPAPTRLHPQHVCVLCQCTAVYRKCRMYPNFSMYPSFLDPKLVERFKIFHSFCQVDILEKYHLGGLAM